MRNGNLSLLHGLGFADANGCMEALKAYLSR
jgi:hypothetical protein